MTRQNTAQCAIHVYSVGCSYICVVPNATLLLLLYLEYDCLPFIDPFMCYNSPGVPAFRTCLQIRLAVTNVLRVLGWKHWTCVWRSEEDRNRLKKKIKGKSMERLEIA